mmetsp:Transcript_18191/g.20234  ORF Transcript_18191/g.20234 Transcript_18191/m.20234 type:complete len:257 (+) Transcript_18191:34-804(+)
MARNEEKANSMLNRWLQMKTNATTKPKKRRPWDVNTVKTIEECETWRSQVTRIVGKKVMEIQNASLEPHVIRDLNNAINKLLGQKRAWERRIRELGGAVYKNGPRGGESGIEGEGGVIIAPSGYKYFGAAKQLPGVQDLLKPQGNQTKKRTRAEIYRGINADYYGFRDDDDGLLTAVEEHAEKRARENAIAQWNKNTKEKEGDDFDPETDFRCVATDEERLAASYTSHVDVPTREDIQNMLVEQRKQALLDFVDTM